MSYRILLLFIPGLLLISCSKKKPDNINPEAGTYFSIRQFAADQWNTFRGQHFGMEKIVQFNGKTDSSLTTAFDMDWAAVLKPFFESDISDPKFLGQYNFSTFKDDATFTINLYYEAKNDKLFTRKLMISVDDVTAKVKSIYIETESSNIQRKLFYLPVRLISIQEFEKDGPVTKELKIDYRFLR